MVKKQSSTLIKALGVAGKKAFDSHKADEVYYTGAGELPKDISGTARLTKCYFATYKDGALKGKHYFLAVGTVVDANDPTVKGMSTMIMEPLCNTPDSGGKRKTVEDHLSYVINEVKKLGLDTEDLDLEELEDALATLVEEGPYFSFRTWQGTPSKQFPNPRVQHNWLGVNEDFTPDEEDSKFVDEESEEEESEEETEETEEESEITPEYLEQLVEAANEEDSEAETELTEIAVSYGKTKTQVGKMPTWEAVRDFILENLETEEEEEEPEEEEEESASVTDLGEAADNGDEEAIQALTEYAENAELDPDEYPTWVELAEALEGAEEGAERGPVVEPEKEDIVYYQADEEEGYLEYSVTSVNKTKKTCSLTSVEDESIKYKNVSWSELTVEIPF